MRWGWTGGGYYEERRPGGRDTLRVVGRLLSYLRPYRWRVALTVVAMLLFTGTTVAGP